MSVLCQKLPASIIYEENTVSQLRMGLRIKGGTYFQEVIITLTCMCVCVNVNKWKIEPQDETTL